MTDNFAFPDLTFDVPTEDDSPARPKKTIPIYTGDLETDPFKHKRYPKPFVSGFYDGHTYKHWWSKSCVDELFAYLETIPAGIIYFHNGGNFDIKGYCMKYLRESPALIINQRIVRGYCKAKKGYHEVRDSYAIMPFALEKYKKTIIDYGIFEKRVRDKKENRAKIVNYLGDDCRDLWDLCNTFVETFGNKITVGQTAMGELRKLHEFETLGQTQDADLRKLYFYGGRVECFQRGILKGKWKVYDVNSMYPFVMKNFLHPIDTPSGETRQIRGSTCFVTVEGRNFGAFPTRGKDNSLRFDIERGTFHVSIHEYTAALDCGLFEPTKIIRCVNFGGRDSFAKFVDHFYELRNKAKDSGDGIRALFYKYILNSAYGKFAQDSSKYLEYIITDGSLSLMQQMWRPITIDQIDRGCKDTFIVWGRKPDTTIAKRYNVATGASITGAARSVLMRAIHKAVNPIYCDTDSLICEDLPGVEHGASELGAWKLEAEADTACVAQKKLYALFAGKKCVKLATKGVKLSACEIRRVCKGEAITYLRDAPSYKLDGSHTFIERTVRMR